LYGVFLQPGNEPPKNLLSYEGYLVEKLNRLVLNASEDELRLAQEYLNDHPLLPFPGQVKEWNWANNLLGQPDSQIPGIVDLRSDVKESLNLKLKDRLQNPSPPQNEQRSVLRNLSLPGMLRELLP